MFCLIIGDPPSQQLEYQAIDILTPESDIHERCVRALSRTCKIYGLLPDSHKVKSTLTKSQHAVASGGFSDVWKAVDENGEVFAVKVLRMYEDSAVQVKKVGQFVWFSTRYQTVSYWASARNFRNTAERLLYPGG